MAIQRILKKKSHHVMWKSGHFYTFKYHPYFNDPKPTVIWMYSFKGIHPTTGRQWRFMQCINLSYVPRAVRKKVVADWSKVLLRSKNVKFTWRFVKTRYPEIKNAVRRYFYTPADRISAAKEIPLDDVEAVVVSSWSKDFSRKVKRAMLSKFKKIMRRRKTFKKTGKMPRRKRS